MFVSPITEKTRTFPVAFQGKTFYVDPNILASYSRRFRRIYNPNNIQLSQLSIVGEYFHESVVEEFLKLCQLESPQIPDLDLPEIAGLAYVFEADKVKESVLSHILSKDPTFIFNENALKNSNIIFSTINHFNHTLDIDQLEFEEDGKATAISNSSSDDNSSGHSNHSEPNLHQMENHHHKHDSNSSGSNHNHIPHSLSENKHNPATYQIILERHALKCTKYWLCLAGETLMAAKSKMLYAAIGNGSEIHLKDHSKIICQIQRHELWDEVQLSDQKFVVKFVHVPASESLTINTKFALNGKRIEWIGQVPHYDAKTGSYRLHLGGAHNKKPMPSRKNYVLKNKQNHCTYIVRKMQQNIFEAECHPKIPPVIVFSIALAAMMGPHVDFTPYPPPA